jgi:hypothetical protein
MRTLFALTVLLMWAGGCTARYSQTLVGEIRRVKINPIEMSDSGTEVGLFHPNNVITFSEPRSSHELLSIPCEVGLAQVDYRSKFYTYLVVANFPEIEVVSYCVAEP